MSALTVVEDGSFSGGGGGLSWSAPGVDRLFRVDCHFIWLSTGVEYLLDKFLIVQSSMPVMIADVLKVILSLLAARLSVRKAGLREVLIWATVLKGFKARWERLGAQPSTDVTFN